MTPEENKNKQKKILIWSISGAVILALLIALMIFLLRPQGDSYEETVVPEFAVSDEAQQPGESLPPVSEQTEKPSDRPENSAAPAYPEVKFPVEVIQGKLTVASVFQFTGPNPDNEGKPGSNLAAIQVKNISGKHLTSAEITLTLTDQSKVTFRVKDLPAGMSALVLSAKNETMDTHSVFMKAHSKATFEDQTPLSDDLVSYSINGRMIEVRNRTQNPLKQVTVYCHCMVGDDSFGGVTYAYQIAEIPAGAGMTVDAEDCFQGRPEVVRITIG